MPHHSAQPIPAVTVRLRSMLFNNDPHIGITLLSLLALLSLKLVECLHSRDVAATTGSQSIQSLEVSRCFCQSHVLIVLTPVDDRTATRTHEVSNCSLFEITSGTESARSFVVVWGPGNLLLVCVPGREEAAVKSAKRPSDVWGLFTSHDRILSCE